MEFGRKQLIISLVCAICYGLVAFGLVPNDPNYVFFSLFFFGLLFVFPVFFGAVFGPWVATIATGIGIFFIDFYITQRPYEVFFFWRPGVAIFTSAIITLSGFFAGLILLKTKGQYNKFGNIAFTTLIGLVYICIAVALIYLIDSIRFNEYYIFPRFFSFIIFLILPCLIQLPLLLLSYNAITRRISQNHP